MAAIETQQEMKLTQWSPPIYIIFGDAERFNPTDGMEHVIYACAHKHIARYETKERSGVQCMYGYNLSYLVMVAIHEPLNLFQHPIPPRTLSPAYQIIKRQCSC